MNAPQPAPLSAECIELEGKLTTLLSRVERRQTLMPAQGPDGEINKILLNGLRDSVNLTHEYMRATINGQTPIYRARKLLALADYAPQFAGMIHKVETRKNLSPIFDRVLQREQAELLQVMGRMHVTLNADSERLAPLLPARKASNPFSAVAMCALLPFVMAAGIVQGVVQGFSEAQQGRTPRLPPPDNKP